MTACAPAALGAGLAAALATGFARGPGAGPRAAALSRGAAALAIAAALLLPDGAAPAAGGLLRLDGWAESWQFLFLLGALPLLALMRAEDEVPAALLLASLLGMSLLAQSTNLLLLFVGLELLSLPAYLLVYRLRPERRSLEAALKYFFVGSVAGALFLFGVSIYYAAAGTLSTHALAPASPRLLFAAALMGAGALFKLGAAPLHFWLPDVYEASAPELAGFFSTAVKAAGLLLLLRVLALVPAAPGGLAAWLPWVSLATMTIGNLLALRQTSAQRLLAYSSLAHVGYLLLGVWAWTLQGGGAPPASVYLYAAAYLFMSTGAFAALRLSGVRDVAQLRGYGARAPGVGAFLTLMLLSLASVPPTAGFLAKLFVFWDGLRAGGVWLVTAAALNSVVGLGYYFSLIRTLYLEEPGPETPPAPGTLPLAARATLWSCAIPTLALGLWPAAQRLAAALLSN